MQVARAYIEARFQDIQSKGRHNDYRRTLDEIALGKHPLQELEKNHKNGLQIGKIFENDHLKTILKEACSWVASVIQISSHNAPI